MTKAEEAAREVAAQPRDWSAFVRELRASMRWSQAQLARHLECHETTIRNWELGRSLPFPYFRKQLLELARYHT